MYTEHLQVLGACFFGVGQWASRGGLFFMCVCKCIVFSLHVHRAFPIHITNPYPPTPTHVPRPSPPTHTHTQYCQQQQSAGTLPVPNPQTCCPPKMMLQAGGMLLGQSHCCSSWGAPACYCVMCMVLCECMVLCDDGGAWVCCCARRIPMVCVWVYGCISTYGVVYIRVAAIRHVVLFRLSCGLQLLVKTNPGIHKHTSSHKLVSCRYSNGCLLLSNHHPHLITLPNTTHTNTIPTPPPTTNTPHTTMPPPQSTLNPPTLNRLWLRSASNLAINSFMSDNFDTNSCSLPLSRCICRCICVL